MSDQDLARISDAVRASFAPILKALGPVRQALASVADVAAVRPGYQYPATGQPVPAVVVAVTPGTPPVNPAELATRFGVPVSVTEATIEEQLAALSRQQGPVSFAPVESPVASAFEALLTGEVPEEFGPPKTGAY